MSDIIRRKIESATGIAPSILGDERLWAAISRGARIWAEAALGASEGPKIQSRRVISSDVYNAEVDFELKFDLQAATGAGLKAIAFDRACGLKSAANRMSQAIDAMGQPSDVFLKLINEGPAAELSTVISKQMVGEAQQSGEAAKPSTRYLEVRMSLPGEAEAGLIALYFDCDFLQARADKGADASDDAPHAMRPGLRASVRRSNLRLDAVLERVPMTVGSCARLEIGDVVPLVDANTNAVAISIQTLSGASEITNGQMGVWHKHRALKLNTPVSSDFIKDLAAP